MPKPKSSEDAVKPVTFNSKAEAFRILCNLFLRKDEFGLSAETKPADIKKRWPQYFEGFEPKGLQRELTVIKKVLLPLPAHKGKTFRKYH